MVLYESDRLSYSGTGLGFGGLSFGESVMQNDDTKIIESKACESVTECVLF